MHFYQTVINAATYTAVHVCDATMFNQGSIAWFKKTYGNEVLKGVFKK